MAFFGAHVIPTDIIAKTPEQVHYRLKIGDPFIHRIMKEGEVLYERGVKE
jgi:siroheme synthase